MNKIKNRNRTGKHRKGGPGKDMPHDKSGKGGETHGRKDKGYTQTRGGGKGSPPAKRGKR